MLDAQTSVGARVPLRSEHVARCANATPSLRGAARVAKRYGKRSGIRLPRTGGVLRVLVDLSVGRLYH